MLENLDKWWGIAAIVGGLLSTLLITVVTATSDSDPSTPETRWQQVLRVLASLITRIFSLSTMSNEGGKKGFQAKFPILQSAEPDTVAAKKAAKRKAKR